MLQLKKIFLSLGIICTCASHSIAQGFAVTLGTQVPLQYNIGLEYEFSKRITGSLSLGVLTKPYDKIILQAMNALGTDEALTNTIGTAFSYGLIVQPGVHWHFSKKYYAGIYGQYMYLQANDAPKDLIESYYGVTLTAPKAPRNQPPESDLIVSSNLYNAGLLIGRRFFFKNPRLQARIEVALAKTLYSYSSVSSTNYYLSNLSSEVNTELSYYYWNYGYIPTLNIYLSFKLHKS